MNKTLDIAMVTTSEELAKAYAVYILQNPSTYEILYIGVERLSQLFTISQARGNSLFHSIIGSQPFVLRLLHICPVRIAALNECSKKIRQWGMPPMIRNRFLHTGIMCIDTGERFRNMSEAAAAHGIGPGNLSKHLSGLPGHVTIKGKRYCRIGE